MIKVFITRRAKIKFSGLGKYQIILKPSRKRRRKSSKILSLTLDVIDQNYESAMLHEDVPMIDLLGRSISYAMKNGINELADLVDLQLEIVLRHLFDEEFDDFNERKMNLIEKEVGEIYEKGNRALDDISRRVAAIYLRIKKMERFE